MTKHDDFFKEMNAKGYDLRLPDCEKNTIRITTGIEALDYVMDGGLAPGHKVELWGENQGGKSLITLRIIAEFQKRDKICVIIDSENAFDAGWATANGVDTDKLFISEPETLEEAGEMMVDMMQKGADLVVVDSIINLINQAESERDLKDPTRGGNAKVNSALTKKLCSFAPNHPTCFVFVNQIRIDMNKKFGDPRDTGGGKALKHFYDTRVLVMPGQVIKENDEIIGKQIVLNCNKNKKGVPRRVNKFDFYHDGTINNNASMLHLAVKYGVIERGGAWYTYQPDTLEGNDPIKPIKGCGEPKFGEAMCLAGLWNEVKIKVWKQINPRLKVEILSLKKEEKEASEAEESKEDSHKPSVEGCTTTDKAEETKAKSGVGAIAPIKKRGRPKKEKK